MNFLFESLSKLKFPEFFLWPSFKDFFQKLGLSISMDSKIDGLYR